MKNRLSLLIIFCLFNCTPPKKAKPVTVRPAIIKIADSIAKENVLEGPMIGYAGRKSRQWARMKSLQRNATSAELRKLTDDTNGVVRCYAFKALTLKHDTAVFGIILNHLGDSKLISTWSYDVGGWEQVGDYFINAVSSNANDPKTYELNSLEKKQLDSSLLYGKGIRLLAKYDVLINLKVNEKYYKRIRELASVQKTPDACVALARYQKQEDLKIISGFFNNEDTEYYGIYAVREFPDSVFYAKLIKVFENEWHHELYDDSKWRILYQALAKYPNQQTLRLFERTVNTKDEYRRNQLGEFLLAALTKYPNPFFESVKSKIRINDTYKEDVSRDIDMEK